MNNMVSRAAMAIDYVSRHPLSEEECRRYALAVITAMWEPTDEMIEIGADVDDASGDFRIGRTSAAAVYRAMIGACLPTSLKEAA